MIKFFFHNRVHSTGDWTRLAFHILLNFLLISRFIWKYIFPILKLLRKMKSNFDKYICYRKPKLKLRGSKTRYEQNSFSYTCYLFQFIMYSDLCLHFPPSLIFSYSCYFFFLDVSFIVGHIAKLVEKTYFET